MKIQYVGGNLNGTEESMLAGTDVNSSLAAKGYRVHLQDVPKGYEQILVAIPDGMTDAEGNQAVRDRWASRNRRNQLADK